MSYKLSSFWGKNNCTNYVKYDHNLNYFFFLKKKKKLDSTEVTNNFYRSIFDTNIFWKKKNSYNHCSSITLSLVVYISLFLNEIKPNSSNWSDWMSIPPLDYGLFVEAFAQKKKKTREEEEEERARKAC